MLNNTSFKSIFGSQSQPIPPISVGQAQKESVGVLFEQFQKEISTLSDEPSLSINLSPKTASGIIIQLQTATQVPGNTKGFQSVEEFAGQLQVLLAGIFKQEIEQLHQADILARQEAEEKEKIRIELENEINRLNSLAQERQSRRRFIDDLSERIGVQLSDSLDDSQLPLPPAGVAAQMSSAAGE